MIIKQFFFLFYLFFPSPYYHESSFYVNSYMFKVNLKGKWGAKAGEFKGSMEGGVPGNKLPNLKD